MHSSIGVSGAYVPPPLTEMELRAQAEGPCAHIQSSTCMSDIHLLMCEAPLVQVELHMQVQGPTACANGAACACAPLTQVALQMQVFTHTAWFRTGHGSAVGRGLGPPGVNNDVQLL